MATGFTWRDTKKGFKVYNFLIFCFEILISENATLIIYLRCKEDSCKSEIAVFSIFVLFEAAEMSFLFFLDLAKMSSSASFISLSLPLLCVSPEFHIILRRTDV